MGTKWRPRGIRNHNPFNIRFSTANAWLGKIPREQNTDPGRAFEQFESAVFGIRAGVKLLLKHWKGDKKRNIPPCDTISKLIHKWAPPHENNTLMYADKVASHAGKDRDEPVDLTEYKTLIRVVEAMIAVENGNMPYKSWELNEGIMLAGVKIERI